MYYNFHQMLKLKNKMSFQKNNKRIHALQVIPKQCRLQRG
jgi:hypothetical protein